MLGAYEFKDAISDLISQTNSFTTRPISQLKDSIVAMDYQHYLKYVLLHSVRHDFKKNTGVLVQRLAEFNITLRIVFPGTQNFDMEALSINLAYCQAYREKIFYFMMISRLSQLDTLKSEKFLKSLMQNRLIGSKDSFIVNYIFYLFQSEMIDWISRNSIAYCRAPQTIESQLVYDHLAYGHLMSTSGLAFVYPGVSQILSEFNLSQGTATFFDFELLARNLNIEPRKLRKVLLGVLLSFVFDNAFRNSCKFIKLSSAKAIEFADDYQSESRKNVELMLQLIRHYDKTFKTCEIDEDFLDGIFASIDIDPDEVYDWASFYLNSVVINSQNSPERYPKSTLVDSPRFLISSKNKELVLLYSKMLIDDSLFHLVNKCMYNTSTVVFPKNDLNLLEKIFRTYYKQAVETSLFRLKSLIRGSGDGHYYFRYFDRAREEFTFQGLRDSVDFILEAIEEPISPYSSLISFGRQVFTLQTNPDLLVTSKPHVKSISHLIANGYIRLFEELGYINIEELNILIPGAAYLKLGAGEFEEELILIFELLRNNCLMPNLLINDQNFSLVSHSNMIRDNIFDFVLHSSDDMEDYIKKNFFSQEQDVLNMSIAFSNSDSRSVSTFNSDSVYPFATLSSQLTKSLNMYYRVINNFEQEYTAFYKNSTPLIPDINRFLEMVFQNDALGRIQVISRIYSFADWSLVLEDYVDVDSSRYKQVITTIQKSVRLLLNSNCIGIAQRQDSAVSLHDLIESQKLNTLFHKCYSTDAGALMKTLMTQFLILDALEALDDPFALDYQQHLTLEAIQAMVKMQFNFLDFLKNGIKLYYYVVNYVRTVIQLSNSSQLGAEIIASSETLDFLTDFVDYFESFE